MIDRKVPNMLYFGDAKISYFCGASTFVNSLMLSYFWMGDPIA